MKSVFIIRFVLLVPGDPQDVKVTPINSTTIKVNWKPPLAKDRNGIIRGYHIHVQEIKEEVITLSFLNIYARVGWRMEVVTRIKVC